MIEMLQIVIVGNKCDLSQDERQLTIKDGQECANNMSKHVGYNIPFFETSAKTSMNVDECFFQIVRLIRKQRDDTNVFDENKTTNKCCNIL